MTATTFDHNELFTQRQFTFKTDEAELHAVRDGHKALAWYSFTREQVEEYSDYNDLVVAATTAGLSVLASPVAGALGRRTSKMANLDVFISRADQAWRVNAFLAAKGVLGRYAWSDSTECLYSAFLGYSDEECTRWIKECRYNRLGWNGQTVYTLLDKVGIRSFAPLGFRAFPSNWDTESTIVVAHPDGWLLRHDLGGILPTGTSLARFAIENEFFLRLFRDAAEGPGPSVSTRTGVDSQRLNEALLSQIELWTTDGWRAPKSRRRPAEH